MGIAGLAATASAADAQDDGAKVYATVCSACHLASGEGVPGVFPPVVESEWVTGDERQLIKIILHGVMGEMMVNGEVYSGMMPPWGGALSDAEIAAVATYMRSNFGNEASAVTPATVASIRKEYSARTTPWTADELLAEGTE